MPPSTAEPAVVSLCTPAAKFRVVLALLPTVDDEGFTVTELAERSGASRSSIYRYLDDLQEVGVVATDPGRQGERYYLADSRFAERVESLSEAASEVVEQSTEHQQNAADSFFT